MTTRKVLAFIFGFLFLGALIFCITWGVINFNKVKEGMSGTGIYTQDDIQKSYEDGYDTALKDKSEYDELINGYRDTITNLNDNVSQLNSQINSLTNNNRDYANQIANLQAAITINQSTIASLNDVIDNNTALISSLNTEISGLNAEISTLESTISNNETELTNKQNAITSLNTQVSTLMSLKTQLEQMNQSNLNTISTLNSQIMNLNAQVQSLTLQIQSNSSSVTTLNNRIAELEDSISYYESYIASLQSANQVVATFEYDGSVYNIQILQAGSTASVVNPTSTSYKIFNGWKVNGTAVNLSNYVINTNTKFVADVTYKYDVTFKVDNSTYTSQIVTSGSCATLPTAPTKNGYEFDGWTLDGTTITNVTTNAITSNTIYVAKFTQVFTATFAYESTTLSTQTIRNGNVATAPSVADTTYKIFNGWKVNGTAVNVATYAITANTTFVADITYKYDVTFKVDNSTYNTQIVTSGSYATTPRTPTKTGYEFDGWTLDGTTIVNVSTNAITSNTIYVAKFSQSIILQLKDSIDNILENGYRQQRVKVGSTLASAIDTSRSGFTFDGFSISSSPNDIFDGSSYIITSNMNWTTIHLNYTCSYTLVDIVDYCNSLDCNSLGDTCLYDYELDTGWEWYEMEDYELDQDFSLTFSNAGIAQLARCVSNVSVRLHIIETYVYDEAIESDAYWYNVTLDGSHNFWDVEIVNNTIQLHIDYTGLLYFKIDHIMIAVE